MVHVTYFANGQTIRMFFDKRDHDTVLRNGSIYTYCTRFYGVRWFIVPSITFSKALNQSTLSEKIDFSLLIDLTGLKGESM